MRGKEAANHAARNALAKDMILMDRTDILKSVAEELVQENETARAESTYLRGWRIEA